MSSSTGKNRVADLDLLDLGSIGVLGILTLIFFMTHWDAYVMLDEAFAAVLGVSFVRLEIFYSMVRFLVVGMTVWFLMLISTGVALKDVRTILYGASLCIPSLILLYLLDFVGVETLSTLTLASLLLILASVKIALGGVAKGLVDGNRLGFSKGDWGGVLKGVKLAALGAVMMLPGFYAYLYNLLDVNVETSGIYSSILGVVLAVLPFVEAYILIFLVMQLPLSLLFVKCKACNSTVLKRSMPVSGWDSEHTLRHRHCPRCGAVIDL